MQISAEGVRLLGEKERQGVDRATSLVLQAGGLATPCSCSLGASGLLSGPTDFWTFFSAHGSISPFRGGGDLMVGSHLPKLRHLRGSTVFPRGQTEVAAIGSGARGCAGGSVRFPLLMLVSALGFQPCLPNRLCRDRGAQNCSRAAPQCPPHSLLCLTPSLTILGDL